MESFVEWEFYKTSKATGYRDLNTCAKLTLFTWKKCDKGLKKLNTKQTDSAWYVSMMRKTIYGAMHLMPVTLSLRNVLSEIFYANDWFIWNQCRKWKYVGWFMYFERGDEKMCKYIKLLMTDPDD